MLTWCRRIRATCYVGSDPRRLQNEKAEAENVVVGNARATDKVPSDIDGAIERMLDNLLHNTREWATDLREYMKERTADGETWEL